MERKIITLIGMPGAGKTKMGKLLAQHLGFAFIDIDDLIKAHFGVTSLQEVVPEVTKVEGPIAIQTLASLTGPTVIATGGSIVYNEGAMKQLKRKTHIICLHASLETITLRIAKNPNRGIVLAPGETLAGLYARRMPLYRKWADSTVQTDHHRKKIVKGLAEELAKKLVCKVSA